jgi:hypothetical protein
LAESLAIPLNGDFTNALSDLSLGGFTKREYTWNFSGAESRMSQVRISDNYTRFYLKYILPRKSRIIKKPIEKKDSLDFLNWGTVFGYQFENLIQNNTNQLIELLEIPSSDIVQLGPFFQTGTNSKQGVQIDYLIQCKRNILHLVEIKSGNKISNEVIAEVQEKIKRLKKPKGYLVRCYLVCLGEVSDTVVQEEFFDKIISFEQFVAG